MDFAQARIEPSENYVHAGGKRRFRGQPLQRNEILPSISLTNSGKWSLR